jgi:hypothetical protein
MADSEPEEYGELVDRLAEDYPGVPQQVVEEQVARAVEGTQFFGEVPTTTDIVETIAAENVSRVDRAMQDGADLGEEDRDPGHAGTGEPGEDRMTGSG